MLANFSNSPPPLFIALSNICGSAPSPICLSASCIAGPASPIIFKNCAVSGPLGIPSNKSFIAAPAAPPTSSMIPNDALKFASS